jgi:hypothetical protein
MVFRSATASTGTISNALASNIGEERVFTLGYARVRSRQQLAKAMHQSAQMFLKVVSTAMGGVPIFLGKLGSEYNVVTAPRLKQTDTAARG